ncbi:MAG: glycosyltransferase family 4 protein [Nitrospirota bacterium]
MKKRIKLLLVSAVFVDRGAERLIIALYNYLPKDIYEIKILCLRNLSPYAEYLNKHTDIKIDVIGMKNNLDFISLFRFYKYIKDFKPDIVNFHHFRAALWGRLFTKLSRVPVVLYSVHNKWGGAIHHFLDKKMSRFTDAIIPFSLAVRNYLIDEEKIEEKYIEEPIYAGIDIEKFSNINKDEVELLRKELGIKNDRNIIGFVGSIDDEKGLIYLIEAVRKLKTTFTDLCCLIIGEGPDKAKFKEIITEYKLENNFVFLGRRYDIYNLLKLMKVFVLPSLREGLPLVVIEAMASSCPVIATNVDGVPEIVTHEKNGWLVPPANADALANAIEVLLADEKLRGQLILKGFETVREKFGIKEMAANYNRLYQRYLNRN